MASAPAPRAPRRPPAGSALAGAGARRRAAGRRRSARWAAVTSVPSEVMRLRSMAFCSSRMLPGHEWRSSSSQRLGRQRRDRRLPILAAERAEEVVGEEQDVLAPARAAAAGAAAKTFRR